ncbi:MULTISPECIES: hypothetical protein [unclassified Microcoleus]|uniref:hypothetical protein n=1 Tax=unclassified Microcoleus TaxID=2642155 RepID=UPI002FD2AF00
MSKIYLLNKQTYCALMSSSTLSLLNACACKVVSRWNQARHRTSDPTPIEATSVGIPVFLAKICYNL